MSQRLWGIDWRSVLPWQLDEIRVEYARLADVLPFMAELFPRTFNTGKQWLEEEMTEAKRRFGEEMDVFVFRDGEKIVGVVTGNPSDWSTYYWRVAGILPEYRRQALLTRFTERCYAPFRAAGVRRMEVDTSPGNRAMVRHLSGQGLFVTATMSSERWGQVLRFTKFLDEDAERTFTTQFLDINTTPNAERRQR
ncbi:MAG: GNAT family N-acetyltransferase [Labilithrix sp.]|nr:GNAT family N-acetyltransferase [Labilithrix sp.]MCW5832413.1 GNAT family N-acetyltransferase [Labilithrix sp.]